MQNVRSQNSSIDGPNEGRISQTPRALPVMNKERLDIISEYLRRQNPNGLEIMRKKSLLSNMSMSAALEMDCTSGSHYFT
jgi:aromatic ring hydroxylase